MNEQNTQQGSLMSNALVAGLILGIASIALSVIFYILEYQGNWSMVPGILVTAGLIYYYIVQYRDKKAEGYISYGQAVGFGSIMSVVSSVMGAIYTYLLGTVINPGYFIEASRKGMEKAVAEGKMSEEQVSAGLDAMEKMSPSFLAIMSSLGVLILGIVFGVIISLIVAAIVKRVNPQSQSF